MSEQQHAIVRAFVEGQRHGEIAKQFSISWPVINDALRTALRASWPPAPASKPAG